MCGVCLKGGACLKIDSAEVHVHGAVQTKEVQVLVEHVADVGHCDFLRPAFDSW